MPIRNRLAALLLLLCLLTCAAAEGTATDLPLPELRLIQFDIGYANAYMITVGEDVILVDCGNVRQDETHGQIMMDLLEATGLKRVTAHFITHFHDDHSGNLTPINQRFGDADTVIYSPATELSPKLLPLANGTHCTFRDGDSVRFGELTIKCVGPDKVRFEGRINNDSLNLLLTYGSRRFYLSGDAVDTRSVVYNHRDEVADVDVFQFPHHGSKPFTVKEPPLAVLNPTYVIVPGSEAFQVKNYLFQNHQRRCMEPQILSAADGTFMFTTDGTSLEVFTHLEPGDFTVAQ